MAGSNAINYGLSWSVNSGTRHSSSVTETQDGLQTISDLAISGPVTNREYDIAITAAKYDTIIILCTSDATLKTNSTSAPDNTLNLKANKAELLTQNAKGFTVDVTKLYLSVAASVSFDFTVDCLVDTTP